MSVNHVVRLQLVYLAMVALETLLTAVVSSISPGTMKSTVVFLSMIDSELGLSQGRPTARATRRRLCFDLGKFSVSY